MSAGHAETSHGHEAAEHGHNNESAIETLTDGIKKIIQSVGIAVKKVLKGIGGFFKDTIGSLFKSDGHGAHGHEAAGHGGGHGAHPPAAGAHH